MADPRRTRRLSYGDTVGWYLRDGFHGVPRFVPLVGMVAVAIAIAALIDRLTA